MAITASAGAKFEVCPAGSFAAVCCDVVDMGIVKTNYSGKEKKQHKIRIGWQVNEDRNDGKPFIVWKRYTLSLHEKSALRKDLEPWRGRPFTEEELQGFDVETVIGAPCMIAVVQNAAGGNVYANVSGIMRLPKGMNAPAVDPAYIRFQDRPKDGEAEGAPEPPDQDFGPDLSDVPF
jgi:hypothetical protein